MRRIVSSRFWVCVALCASLACATGGEPVAPTPDATPAVAADGEKQADPVRVFTRVKALADQGNVEAKMQLGVLYNKGIGTPADSKRACELFREAADAGLSEGQAATGICLMQGPNPDGRQAEQWLLLAAEQSTPGAQYNLALLHLKGIGVEANRTKGMRWARRAAVLDHAQAQELVRALDKSATDAWFVLPAPEDPARYTGDKSGSVMQGKGVYTFEDGTKYEGDFDQDRMHGAGKVTWTNGRTYEGGFENNDMKGRGHLSRDGMVQNGEFTDGLLEGPGSMRWPDGRIYAGMFHRGLPHGNGQMLAPDGKSYNGEFARGVPHGPGKMTLPDGRTREGFWKEGKFAMDKAPADQPDPAPPTAPNSQ